MRSPVPMLTQPLAKSMAAALTSRHHSGVLHASAEDPAQYVLKRRVWRVIAHRGGRSSTHHQYAVARIHHRAHDRAHDRVREVPGSGGQPGERICGVRQASRRAHRRRKDPTPRALAPIAEPARISRCDRLTSYPWTTITAWYRSAAPVTRPASRRMHRRPAHADRCLRCSRTARTRRLGRRRGRPAHR
jgi:hypothetical protein